MMDEVTAVFRQRDGFVIAGHKDPDGDSLGSSMALALGLEQLGKRTAVVSADRPAPAYRRLPQMHRVKHVDGLPDGYPIAVVIECNGTERTGLTGFEDRLVVNIDHHANNPRFADINWIVPEVAAAGVMIHELLLELGVEITPDIATHLYVTVLTDTGSFRHSNTDAAAFRLCADLVDRGADPAAVASAVYQHVPVAKVRLLGRALDSLSLEDDGRIALMALPYDALQDYPGVPDTEGIVNHARAIEGVDVALLLKEVEPRRFRVSLRSNGAVDVAALATELGGGGHPRAAGCQAEGSFEEVRRRLLEAVRSRRSPDVGRREAG